MTDPNATELRRLRIQEQELELRRGELAVQFAKFGFAGTLTAALGGMLMILALAIIDSMSAEFTYGAEGVIWTTVCITIACVAFGGFSLRQPIKILAHLGEIKIGVQSETQARTPRQE